LITQHELSLNSCVTAAAKYTFFNRPLDKTILFPALHRVVEAHGALGVRLVGASSKHPAFQRLQSVDFGKIVHYSDQDGDSLQHVLETHLMRFFDTNAELPLWGITVLTDNTVIFFWHHCIGDGMSGLAFHEALLSALNADNTIYEGRESVIIPSTISIIPAIESLISIRPSIRQLYRNAIEFFAPISWTSGGSAWTGNPPKESSCRAEIRILEFSPEEHARFVASCRKNNATLTPTLHVLAVSALSQLLHPNTNSVSRKSWETISTLIPVSLRPVAQTSPSVMCNHVSQYPTFTTLTPKFSWAAASTLTSTVHSFRAVGGPGELGILMFIFGQFEGFWKAKFGKKREVGLEVSSIGPFNPASAHTDPQKWVIDRVIFAQSDVGTGAAIKLNVCGNPLGGLAIAVTWGLDAVDAAFAEAFISKFRHMFQEIVEVEKQ
jgi:hypothetical protein